jgi:uncharacterized protein (TIGR02996 family)
MSSHAAFLQAITSAPEDDTHRLVYADWLDDNGDPRRAEFIRLQCRLASTDECDPERPDLLDREWELLAVYRKRWQPSPETVLGQYPYGSEFVRGFLGRVSLPASVLLEHGEDLFRDWPLQELRLREFHGWLGEVLARRWLSGVTSLDLSEQALSDDDIRALMASTQLQGLRRLTLCAATQDGIELLARWPGLRGITHLSLWTDRRIPGRTPVTLLRRLLESPHLGPIVSLAITDPLTDGDMALLASSPRLGALARLNISCSPEGLRSLAAATGLPVLRDLSLRRHGGTTEGLPDLLGSPLIGRLDALDLMDTIFDIQAAWALASSPHLGRLRKLDLTQRSLGPEEARALASARFGSLTELNLFNNKIGPAGMIALAASPHLATLRSLSLMSNEIGTEGLRALADAPTLAGLRSLDLGRNRLGVDEAKVLAGSPHRSQLRHLSLWMNDIGARGAQAILLSPNLAGLWSLNLAGSSVTDATAQQVLAKTPLRELRRLIFDFSWARKLTAAGERALATSDRLPHLLVINRGGSFSYRDLSEVSPVVLEAGKGQELK